MKPHLTTPSGPWTPGRDSRAVRHPGPGGRSQWASSSAPVVVAGGGIAGLAAATGLAERGVPVILVEPQTSLGGRVRAWPVDHDGDQVTMSRGFHAFFRQYYNLRALLRRVDPALECLTPIEDYPLILAGGHADSFASIPRQPPLNLLAFVAQSPSFGLRDLAKVNVPAAMELLDVEFPGTFSAYDGESAAAFLDRLRFPPAARHLALEVFARSFFAEPETFSAGELVAMFHSYFLGSAEGLLFDVPNDDYDTAMWAPLGRYLAGLGVDVRTRQAVSGLDLSHPDRIRVGIGDEQLQASAVVLATDPHTTRALLLDASLGSGSGWDEWRRRVDAVHTAPPFGVWRLWLDRQVNCDRPPFLGTSGFGPLDNVTVLERFEAGAARWSRENGGSVVELHAYALVGEVDSQVVRHRLWTELIRIYPELSGATVVAEEWLLAEDCPLAGTGPWTDRLTVETPHTRLKLAGDTVRCDYPVALMERATTTGFLAANQLLADRDVSGHDLWTVPMQSRHRVAAPLHKLMTSAPLHGALLKGPAYGAFAGDPAAIEDKADSFAG